MVSFPSWALLSGAVYAILSSASPAATPTNVAARETAAGWSFGNPPASRHLVEYSSFGCGHCGLFAKQAGPAVAAAVRTGRLRFELRPFLIFPQDRPAAVLARCVPSPRRFGFYEAVMADQDRIKTALAAADADDNLRGMLYNAELAGPEALAGAVARVSGIDRIAQAHGLTASATTACLSDAGNHAWVSEADLAARLAGVTGTPTFIYGGRRQPMSITPTQLKGVLSR